VSVAVARPVKSTGVRFVKVMFPAVLVMVPDPFVAADGV
jgi:hypothetical protein